MVIQVLTEVEIEAPQKLVARYATDPTNSSAWYKHVLAVEGPDPAPLQHGSAFTLVARIPPGITRRFPYEVVNLVEGKRLIIRTEDGPFPMQTTYSWLTRDGRTVMTMRNEISPRGPARIVAPLLVAGMRRANHKDLLRLKSILESSTDSAG
jgi:hypothetical protein